jgi:hypothetical protein
VKLLVIPFGVEEVNGATAGSHNGSFMVTALTLQECHSLIKCLRPDLERLVSDAVLLKCVALEWMRTLKQHHIRIAALHPDKACARLADSIGYFHTENLGVKIFRPTNVVYRDTNVVYANRLNHGFALLLVILLKAGLARVIISENARGINETFDLWIMLSGSYHRAKTAVKTYQAAQSSFTIIIHPLPYRLLPVFRFYFILRGTNFIDERTRRR